MKPATTLPYEILFDCLDFSATHPSNTLHPDYKCLRSLSLVSRQVSIYAQKALFRSVFLSKNRHAIAFGNALNPGTEKGRWLASLVITLKAEVRKDYGSLTQQPSNDADLRLHLLLARTYDLDVANTAFDMSAFSTAFFSHVVPIQTLRISAPDSTAPDFLSVFPSLKFVEFKRIVTSRVPQGSPPSCRLTELHWPGPVHDYLFWVLQNSVGILEILALPSSHYSLIFEDDRFERLMYTYGPSLRSLHISSSSDNQMASLRHCTKLEELILDGMPWGAALGRLPETIEHLQIEFTDDERVLGDSHPPLSYLGHFIETAPSLLTFTWVHESAPACKVLQELCECRGIVWRKWIQPYGVYPGERQEIGYVDTFPRALPLSPLRARDLASAMNLGHDNSLR